ncbi:MAG: hypothetical protein ACLP2Y_09020 [Limisphaerales bacterium]
MENTKTSSTVGAASLWNICPNKIQLRQERHRNMPLLTELFLKRKNYKDAAATRLKTVMQGGSKPAIILPE